MRILPLFLAVSFSGGAFGIEVDDSPAPPGTWGFRPTEGTIVDTNPPGFTWRPVSGAQTYLLQIAADGDFKKILYESGPTPWSAHGPSKTFPTGVPLYWRYAAKDSQGSASEWSQVRVFTVEPDAPLFPKLTVKEAREKISKEHPKLFFRGEEIDRLRKLNAGALKKRWEDLAVAAEKTIQDPPDTSEPPHYPEGTEFKGEKWKEIWWGNRLRTIAVTDGAANLAFVYRLSGDEKYGKAARDLLMAFCEWDPEGSTEYNYNDEAGMPALYFPSRAYTWAYPLLSEEDRGKVVETMRIRGTQCFNHLQLRKHLWNPYASHSNRAWHFLGEVALAFIDEIPEAETWLDFALTVFYTCYPVWGDSDGGWHEGVSYWKSYLERFGYWALAMDSAFGVDVFQKPFFRSTGYYGMYMVPPGTTHAAFGDLSSGGKPDRDCGSFMALAASGAQNPYWKWYADQVEGDFPANYVGYLWAAKAAGLEPKPPSGLPSSRCFYGTGVAVLNTNLLDGKENVQLFFKSSPLGSQSHGYNANNTIHLNIFGKPALVNTGQRDIHGSPHHTKWMWETKSQNAILVNGQGQEPHSPEAVGRITFFETTPDLDIVVGEAGDSYPQLDRWTRAIVFVKPDLFLIHDVLEAPKPSTFQFLLHAPSQFILATDSDPPLATWTDEEVAVDIDFLYPPGLQISQKNGYEPPPHEWAGFKIDEWHLTAEPERKRTQQTFLTLLSINGSERDAEYDVLDRDKEAFAIQIDDGPTLVLESAKLSIAGEDFEREIIYTP